MQINNFLPSIDLLEGAYYGSRTNSIESPTIATLSNISRLLSATNKSHYLPWQLKITIIFISVITNAVGANEKASHETRHFAKEVSKQMSVRIELINAGLLIGLYHIGQTTFAVTSLTFLALGFIQKNISLPQNVKSVMEGINKVTYISTFIILGGPFERCICISILAINALNSRFVPEKYRYDIIGTVVKKYNEMVANLERERNEVVS